MKFYEIDNSLQEEINFADKAVRLKIEVDILGDGRFESVFEDDIIEADFFSIKEAAGGVSSRGEVLLNNIQGAYSFLRVKSGTEVKVSFSIGDGEPYFQRFTFYVDDKGVQDIKGSGRKRFVKLGLRDLSYKLRKTDEARDWTAPAVFVYLAVCDKNIPEKSILHGIAARAGLGVNDIDCSTIPVSLPYVRLRRNTWAELSSLATAYRCHLECTPDKKLIFCHSPYQNESIIEDDIAHTFTGSDIFYLRKMSRAELYRNTVRLKINMPVSLGKQEIWRYEDPPVLYDDDLKAYYPFKNSYIREIQAGIYEADYIVYEECGKERNVIYADEIDTKEEAEQRLEYDEGNFSYSHYDTITNFDKALLTIGCEQEGNLFDAVIHGRPIVLDLNRSCFMRDVEAVDRFGTVALNITGSYFSEETVYEKSGIPVMQYEDWVMRELAERLEEKEEYTVRTHKALFHARVGAKVKIKTLKETLTGTINAFSLRYRRKSAFVSTFKILS